MSEVRKKRLSCCCSVYKAKHLSLYADCDDLQLCVSVCDAAMRDCDLLPALHKSPGWYYFRLNSTYYYLNYHHYYIHTTEN